MIFIDGPSMNIIDGYPSLIFIDGPSLNIIDGYPSMLFIDGYPPMNINGYPVLTQCKLPQRLKPQIVTNHRSFETLQHAALLYQKWPSKHSILSRVYPGYLFHAFLHLSPPDFPNIFCKTNICIYIYIENRKSETLETQTNQVH